MKMIIISDIINYRQPKVKNITVNMIVRMEVLLWRSVGAHMGLMRL